MIEKIVLEFLNKRLETPVLMEQPVEKIQEYVLIEKTGSSESDCINNATIVVQSYGSTLYKAAALNEAVKAEMKQFITIRGISRAKLNTDYNFTDTTKKKYRYQAVYDITYQEGVKHGK